MKTLNLGTELTRNELKKVLGGWATCTNGFYHETLNCSSAAAYCAATGRGTMQSCG